MRFFRWIRDSRLSRTDDRWIGGVCGGLARRFDISPTLMRALLLGSALLFGFGAAFYAFAWFLLPDDRDGTIACEQLLDGRPDWTCAGCALMLIAGIWIPYAGFFAACAAVFVLWVLVQQQVRRLRDGLGGADAAAGRGGARKYRAAWADPAYRPAPAPGPSAYPGAAPFGSPEQRRAETGRSGASGASEPATMGAATYAPMPTASGASGAASSAGAPTMPTSAGPGSPNEPAWHDRSQPGMPQSSRSPYDGAATGQYRQQSQQSQFSSQPQSGPQPFPPSPSRSGPFPVDPAPTFAVAVPRPAMTAPRPAPKRYARRRPAGPILVSSMLGLIFLSAAIALFTVSDASIEQIVRVSTIWIGGVCLTLAGVILVLGLMGRRAGGLTPIAWIAGIVAVSVIAVNLSYSYLYSGYTDYATSYGIVKVDGHMRSSGLDAHSGTESDMLTAMRNGVAIEGTDYDTDVFTLDLTDFKNGASHGLELSNGNTARSICPTGTLSLAVHKAQTVIILPSGCTYGFGDSDYGYSIGYESYGGKYSAMRGLWGFGVSFGYDHAISYETSTTDWESDGVTPMYGPELYVNPAYLIEGRVTVRYEDDTTTGTNGVAYRSDRAADSSAATAEAIMTAAKENDHE